MRYVEPPVCTGRRTDYKVRKSARETGPAAPKSTRVAAGVEESLAFAPGMLTPDYQGEGMSFGPRVEVGPDAPAFDRLLGLSGRDPQWRRPA